MVTRRDFLKAGAAAGAGAALPIGLRTQYAQAAPPSPPPFTITKFVEALPIPGAIDKTAGGTMTLSIDSYQAVAGDLTTGHVFHSNPATNELLHASTFGYGGAHYLGPTIIAQRGVPIQVTNSNNLGAHPLAPWVDPNNGIMGILASDAQSPRVSTHLHGAYTDVASDGGPTDTFTPGSTYTYNYTNDQQAANLWYHDHALGITRLNVYAGLAGFYLLRDNFDTGAVGNPIGLPAGYGTYEIPVVIQDKAFVLNAGGQTANLQYTVPPAGFAPSAWVPEFFGDVAVVNGKTWPFLNVEPAIYRFRIVNGSMARFYNLSLSNGDLIYQIGTDSGLLDAPVRMKALLLAPGERADILLDFTRDAGTTLVLKNNAPTPFPSGKRATHAGGVALPDLMQFRVGTTRGASAVTVLPATLRGGTGKPPALIPLTGLTPHVTKVRNLLLFEVLDPLTGLPVLDSLNIVHLDESVPVPRNLPPLATTFKDAVSATANTLEQWNIINMTADTHPIHVHLVQYRLLSRQSFDTRKYLAALNALGTRNVPALNITGGVPVPNTLTGGIPDVTPFLQGKPFPPAANETGWKDTIQMPPGQVTSILVPFGQVPAISTSANDIPFGLAGAHKGTYVWHCHILDHEENEMMNFYDVV